MSQAGLAVSQSLPSYRLYLQRRRTRADGRLRESGAFPQSHAPRVLVCYHKGGHKGHGTGLQTRVRFQHAERRNHDTEIPPRLRGMRSWYAREVQMIQKEYLSEMQQTRQAYLNANQPESAKDVEAEIASVQNETPGSPCRGIDENTRGLIF